MANSLTALNPELWKPLVQDYLNNTLVSMAVANVRCEALLSSGDQVNFPYVNDVRVQDYTQGTDLTMDNLTATADALTISSSKAATFVMDPVQERQALANYGADLAYQAAYQLRNNIDQTVIASGVDNAAGSVTGGTLTSSTMISKLTDLYAELQRANATDGEMFVILDPERTALLSQTFIANGFTVGDNTLRNGFAGKALGFDVYTSNNLKYSQTLQMATIPTATDDISIAGVTWTFVASGGATAAGDISIGADVAATKANILLAVNGTGTPGAATYIEIATASRRKYQNAQIAAAAWGSDECVITGYTRISGTETFTDATDTWGTETTNMLAGRKGAMSLAIQMQPELYIREEPAQIARNYITHTLYGAATFTRDKDRLSVLTANA